MSNPNPKSELYKKVHELLALQFHTTPYIIQFIRSLVGEKKTQKDIAFWAVKKLAVVRQEERRKKIQSLLDFTASCTKETWAYINQPAETYGLTT